MIEKSISIFGREIYRVERNREGVFEYELLRGGNTTKDSDYLKLSLENPVLMTIIALRAKMYSQMKITHHKSNGDIVENSPYVNLLAQPNYFQSQEDFFFQQMWYLSATGNNYCYKIKSLGQDKSLYNLIPNEIDFNDIFKIDKFIATQQEMADFGKKTIKYKLETITKNIQISEIIPFYDLSNGLIKNTWMRSPSRVEGIKDVLLNLEENIKSKGLNLEFSQKYLAINKKQVQGTSAPLQEDDRKSISDILRRKSLQISSNDIEVKHLVSDLKKLFLDEQFASDALKCLLAFDMNKDILNYFGTGASTYENQEKGELRYLQNSIITSANNTMNSLSSSFGLLDKGEYLKASYDHLPIMQGIMNDKIKTLSEFITALKSGLEIDVIDSAEAKEMLSRIRKSLNI